ncbi:MAG: LysR substrate-binding domain-containing protein [Pseudomonadota bacterium]
MQDTTASHFQKIRLRQVRCFVTVARKKSFVLAADDMGLTQPAVSRSVRELEQNLGHDLFDRTTRGAELTDRGREFFDAAEAALLQLSHGTSAVLGNQSPHESVRVGALPNVCSQFLPDIVKAFKSDFPDTRVLIIPGTNAGLLAGLRRGDSDLVIGRLSSSDAMRGLAFEAIYDEPLLFVVRAEHPLADGRATINAIADYPMVLPPEGTIIRQEASRFLAGNGIDRISDLVETTSSDFQRAYIADTDCVAVIPRGVVQADLAAGKVTDLRIGVGELQGPVGLTTNPDRKPGRALSGFLARVRAGL